MQSMYDLTLKDISAIMKSEGYPAFRSRQIWQWLHKKQVQSFDDMYTLPKHLRSILRRRFSLDLPTISTKQHSRDGTIKLLLEDCEKKDSFEAVMLPKGKKITLCVSTQVGCSLGCKFCETGRMGFVRNLRVSEIIGQLIRAREIAGDRSITNVVFMGMGEALLNYSAFFQAVSILMDSDAYGMGARKITLSTAGFVPGIDRMIQDGLRINLAVSLNAVSDSERTRIMPINKRYPLSDLFAAGQRYARHIQAPVTYEYVLIKDANDDDQSAMQLVQLMQSIRGKVNLIPLNSCTSEGMTPPSLPRVDAFSRILSDAHITVTVRRSGGEDIQGACGQLAKK
ncbi:MAG: 23S rRNA (adenine(2503)-C(2))-methyltransferase RlmN [Fibrobacterota bacterium]